MRKLQDWFGICQWFHYQDRERVILTRNLLRQLHIKHLRMDISWADYHRSEGPLWYQYLFSELAEFKLLPCVWHTPPSLSMTGRSNGPPKKPEWFAEFIEEILELWGQNFHAIELWNEPNNWIKWNTNVDPDWVHFVATIKGAAAVAKRYGQQTVLGGMSPINGGWLDYLRQHDQEALDNIDVIGIHAFPGQWNEPIRKWAGWSSVFSHLKRHTGGREIWVTETGFSTSVHCGETKQINRLCEVLLDGTPATRVYWYSLLDLPDDYPEIEQLVAGYEEKLEHSLGLVTQSGVPKAAFHVLKGII